MLLILKENTLDLIRSRRLKHPRLQYKSYGLNHQWQLDLVDLHAVGRQKGNRFLLTKIDVFSRQADAKLLSSNILYMF